MTPEQQRIREFAYQIWQSEGCPHGQEGRHWEMARKLVEAQQQALATNKPASRARKPVTKPTEVEAIAAAPADKPRTARATTKKAASPVASVDVPQPAKKPRSPRAKKDA